MKRFLIFVAVALSQKSMEAFSIIDTNKIVDEDDFNPPPLTKQALRDICCRDYDFPPNHIYKVESLICIPTVNFHEVDGTLQWDQKIRVSMNGYCLNGKFSSNNPTEGKIVTVAIPATPDQGNELLTNRMR